MIQIDAHSASFDVLRDVAAHLNQRLEEELRAANQRIGAKLNAEAKRIMVRDIYSVEAPFLKRATEKERAKFAGTSRQRNRGRRIRRWVRSGDLLNNERVAFRTEDRGVFSVVLVNAMEYATPRYVLGLPGHRQAGEQSGESPTRSVQWQEQAVEEQQVWIRVQYEQAIERALRGA
ncbi:MAG: hypothetical protein Q7R40_14225 [Phaeospirillum sp.]|nr:hypothetical protein [Phaeospirillum sp.]